MTVFTPSPVRRLPAIVRALQWFVRFSQFYGEYQSIAPHQQRQWVNQQIAKEQAR